MQNRRKIVSKAGERDNEDSHKNTELTTTTFMQRTFIHHWYFSSYFTFKDSKQNIFYSPALTSVFASQSQCFTGKDGLWTSEVFPLSNQTWPYLSSLSPAVLFKGQWRIKDKWKHFPQVEGILRIFSIKAATQDSSELSLFSSFPSLVGFSYPPWSTKKRAYLSFLPQKNTHYFQ